MNRFLVSVAWLGASIALAAQSAPGRWFLEARGGVILDGGDSPGAFLRKDGQPGNPLVQVKRQRALSVRGAFAATSWLEVSLDGSQADLECASDRLDGNPVAPFVAGKAHLFRAGCWISLADDARRSFHDPANAARARFMAGLLVGRLSVSGLRPLNPGAADLGVESLQSESRFIASLEVRGELKLLAGWVLSLEVTTFRGTSGNAITVGTAAGSPFQGTGIRLAPTQILLGLGHPF